MVNNNARAKLAGNDTTRAKRVKNDIAMCSPDSRWGQI